MSIRLPWPRSARPRARSRRRGAGFHRRRPGGVPGAPTVLLLAVVVAAGGCARAAASAGGAGVSSPGAGHEGLWKVSMAVGQRATYTGTLTVTRRAQALSGVLRLTSPISVDANLTGAVTSGVMTLSGAYTAGNGCTGTIRITARGAAPQLNGPTEMDDTCVGRLAATTTLQR